MPTGLIVIDQASDINTDVTNFDNNLSGSDTDVQTALETLDELAAGGGGSPGGSNKQVQFNNSSAFGGAAGSQYQSGASPNVLLQAQNAGYVPFVLKGAASQSGNLQQWQNSGGTVLTAIDKDGFIDLSAAGETGTQLVLKLGAGTVEGYGSGFNKLNGNEFFNMAGAAAGSSIFSGGVASDSKRRIRIKASGEIVWGSGAADVDTNLKRDAANVLKTDDKFEASGGILVSGGVLTLPSGVNIVLGSTSGSEIGTATGQKIGFWGVTPVAQQVLATGAAATVDNVISFLQTLGLCKQS